MANKIALWVNHFVTGFGWLILLLYIVSIISGDFDTIYDITKLLIENLLSVFLAVWEIASAFVSSVFSKITE
ncbi:MAG: hypothetical protein PVI21_01180 [Candidatus Woesebacteria bacterium]|jgi:hypothetical protein